MRHLVLTALYLLATQMAKSQADTVTTYFDKDWKEIPRVEGAAFYAKTWPEKGQWHRKDFYLPENTLQMDAWFADKATTQKEGVFTTYKKDGSIDIQQYYEGEHSILPGKPGWRQEAGQEVFEWRSPAGKLTLKKATDAAGNGTATYYHADGRTVASSGKLQNFKKEGEWTFVDENKITSMTIAYEAGKETAKTCYDEKGKAISSGNCGVAVPAMFKGGLEGWKTFLEKNLRYPKNARKSDAEGQVKIQFIVQPDGSVTDLKVLSSPDIALSEEAMRVLEKSKWVPATMYNRPVIYRHIQTITFQLN